MQNCRVKLLKRSDTLSAGHRVAGGEAEVDLWSGPAHLSAPTRSWEQQAALEQSITGNLIVHTHVNLTQITTAVISDHVQAGEYEVLGVANSGMGWTLTLGRRRTHGKP